MAVRLLNEKFADAAERLPEFSIIVKNGGTSPIFFSPDNVTAFSGEQPVTVTAFGELNAKMLREAQIAAGRTTLLGKDVTEDGETSSRDPITMRPPIWDHVEPPRESSLDHILGASSIVPGDLNGGVVKLNADEIQPGVPLRLVVRVSGEVHEFLFDVRN